MQNKFQNLTLKKEENTNGDLGVIKCDENEGPAIQEYQFESIQSQSDYLHAKSKFGALAATDLDKKKTNKHLTKRDNRFQVSPVLREILSIEEEEKRAIEEKVRTRVSTLSDEIKERAWSSGYEEGKKQGYNDSFQKYKDEGQIRVKEFEKFISECENAKAEIFKSNERFLIELIYRITRMILLKELETDKEYLLRLTKELIEKVGVRDNITIKLNTEDMATAEQLKAGLTKSLGILSNLGIEMSNAVKRGGCVIETQWNVIDANIETQLHGIYEGLLGRKS